jgi:hypothetical protein
MFRWRWCIDDLWIELVLHGLDTLWRRLQICCILCHGLFKPLYLFNQVLFLLPNLAGGWVGRYPSVKSFAGLVNIETNWSQVFKEKLVLKLPLPRSMDRHPSTKKKPCWACQKVCGKFLWINITKSCIYIYQSMVASLKQILVVLAWSQ